MGIVYKLKNTYLIDAVPRFQPTGLCQTHRALAKTDVLKVTIGGKHIKNYKLSTKNKSYLKDLGFKILRNGKS
jgi:hypothetical protein